MTSNVTLFPEPGRSRHGQFAQLAVKEESPAQLACGATTGTTVAAQTMPALRRHATLRIQHAKPDASGLLTSEVLAS